MKILFTTSFYPPYHIGGDAVHVKYLAEALAGMGHEVHVLHSMDAYEFKRGAKKEEFSAVPNLTVHSMRSPLGRLEPILNYCLGTQKYTLDYFTSLVKKEKFDVVHHHNISLLGYNILRKQGSYRNLYTAHDYWLVCHKYDLMSGHGMCQGKDCFACCLRNRKPYQFFRSTDEFRRALGDIDEIIAPSRYMGDTLAKEFRNVNVIHNFINNPFRGKRSKHKEDYFIFAGVLAANKGILDLVDVFSGLKKNLLVVGKGEAEPEIRKRISERGLKNVHLLGWKKQDELFPLIRSAQALVVPSVWPENNPLIALESLSLGTPVIGSARGGIPEIVEKLDKSLIFSDLAGLGRIIEGFDRSRYRSSAVSEVYEGNFSQGIFFEKYFRLIGHNGRGDRCKKGGRSKEDKKKGDAMETRKEGSGGEKRISKGGAGK